jgi:hypothetical protein
MRILRRNPGTTRRALARLVLLAGLAGSTEARATALLVHPDSALAFGPPYYATVLEANAVAVAGDTMAVSVAGSPYIHTALMALVNGVVYRGGYGPAFEGPNTTLYETTIELQAPVGVLDSVIETGPVDASTVLAGFTITGGVSSFSGGGVFCSAGSALTIRNCRIAGNSAGAIGGGIAVTGTSSVQIFNCDIEDNVAGLRGGGIAVAPNAALAKIEFCRIVRCSSATAGQTDGGGGGVFSASPIFLTRSEIRDCWTGYRGGGLLVRNADLKGHGNQFSGNIAQLDGGGAYHEAANGEHLSSSFENCTALGGEGGGLSFEGGSWLVSECFVRDCSASARGGGIYFDRATGAELLLTEVIRNTAPEGGGVGIVGTLFRSPLSVLVQSCTIALNAATAGSEAAGGIQIFPEGNYLDEIVNCIIAEQAAGTGIACEGAENMPNIRYCCVWNRDTVNLDDEYGRDCDDRTGINGNIRLDPLFCDLTASPPQVGVMNFSPTRAVGSDGEDLGAHPGTSDCPFVSVEAESWGRIKSRFR